MEIFHGLTHKNALRREHYTIMKLKELLPKEAVFPHVEALDKKQSLRQMASLATDICGVPEKEIYNELMDREQQSTTCMGSGVCVPNGRFIALDRPYAFFARFDSPIEFNGEDGMPIDLMFLLLSPQDANTEHMKSMALLSRLLRNKVLCTQLRVTKDADMLYNLLYEASVEDNA